MEIIDGKKIAERIKDEIVADTCQIANSASNRRPNLAIILVGEREDSKLYVSLKEKEGVKIGIDTNLYKLDESTSEAEILNLIGFLNRDEMIDGILVQLPLPEKFDTDKIIKTINPLKDADGFHPQHPAYLISPVLGSILEILKEIKFFSQGKRACVLYNSEVFGSTLAASLKSLGLAIDLVSFKDLDLSDDKKQQFKREEIKKISVQADLLISALGLPGFVTKEMVKSGSVIIDIGITKLAGKVRGDVDFADVKDVSAYITPVPGGIGPLTIALLFRNVLEIYKHRK